MRAIFFAAIALVIALGACRQPENHTEETIKAMELAAATPEPAQDLIARFRSLILNGKTDQARRVLFLIKKHYPDSDAYKGALSEMIAHDEAIKEQELKDKIESMSSWRYDTANNPMGDIKFEFASVKSMNEVTFSFPADTPQKAELTFRKNGKTGRDVILSLKYGQFHCVDIDNCTVRLKFDDGKIETRSFTFPQDGSRNCIFISGFEGLLKKTRQSKSLMIEAGFYQEGVQTFVFPTQHMTW